MTNAPEWIKEQTNKLIESAYQRGYKVGREEGFDEWVNTDVNASIEQGRNEAWEAAKYCVNIDEARQYNYAFDGYIAKEILENYTASEAIEKIKAYEEQKKNEENNEIRVGDEIYAMDVNCLSVVTCIYDCYGVEKATCITQNGKCYVNSISDLHKTGRTFPQIAEVLKKLQEGKE